MDKNIEEDIDKTLKYLNILNNEIQMSFFEDQSIYFGLDDKVPFFFTYIFRSLISRSAKILLITISNSNFTKGVMDERW